MASIGVIYIGTFALADTLEDDFANENDDVYAGTHGNSVLQSLIVDVTEPLGDGIAYDDDDTQVGSQITYDLGGGAQTVSQDSVASYNVSLSLGDGTTLNTIVNVIQLTNGATFINENIDGVPLDNLNIQAVTLGTVVEDNAYGWMTARSIDNARIVCFASGTLIETPQGQRAVEDLTVGDLVTTLDHGPQPVIWHALQVASGLGNTAPIEVGAHALGPGMPFRRLLLSPQHRVLLRSPIVNRMVGTEEALVAAKLLCDAVGISVKPYLNKVTYHHILLPQHAILWANGAAAESFFPGPEALKSLEPAQLAQLNKCLEQRGGDYGLCRDTIKRKTSGKLVARHAKNCLPMVNLKSKTAARGPLALRKKCGAVRLLPRRAEGYNRDRPSL
ncbi:Hemolysin-type calcium-binding protein [Sulfitobacter noctilucae]|uniref:Hint domain-containing protein n=1 Tax=Sulfitobacter noctilucae TaxID=1342302 RepID=UPI0004690D4F|nr:Hint domain-containing protein [Sulfitobacter noctilucae]KIN60910.1 Hemolysin-type calcium-binding protein [Sulfitobacter noctilucae]